MYMLVGGLSKLAWHGVYVPQEALLQGRSIGRMCWRQGVIAM